MAWLVHVMGGTMGYVWLYLHDAESRWYANACSNLARAVDRLLKSWLGKLPGNMKELNSRLVRNDFKQEDTMLT